MSARSLRLLILCLSLSGCAAVVSPAHRLSQEITIHRRAGTSYAFIPTPGTSHYPLYLQLKKHVEQRLQLVVVEIPMDDWGRTDGTHYIAIRSGMSGNGKFETLTHELGHVFDDSGNQFQLKGQVIAEASSQLVCRQVGLSNSGQMFAYFLFELPTHIVAEDIVLQYRALIERIAQQTLDLLAERP
jgi:hypothetical protein